MTDSWIPAHEDAARDRRGAVAVAYLVEREVERGVVHPLEGERELDAILVLEVREREADEREALRTDQRLRFAEQASRRLQDRLCPRGRLGQRLRAGGAREVGEAEAQHDRAAHALASTEPARDAVDDGDERRVDLLRRPGPQAERPLRPDRAAPPTDPHRPRVAVVRQRVQLPARRAPDHPDEDLLVQAGDLADRRDSPTVQLGGGDPADSPQPFDRERMEESELVVRWHHE